jgi:hypothetical protein
MSMSRATYVAARSPLTLVYRHEGEEWEECAASALFDLQMSGFTQEIPDDPQIVQAKPDSDLRCERVPFASQQLAPWDAVPHPEMPLHCTRMFLVVEQRHVSTEHPRVLRELIGWLKKQAWSDFAQSLVAQASNRGGLTSNQLAAARSMREKTERTRAQRSAARDRMGWALMKASMNHGKAERAHALAYTRDSDALAQAAEAGEVK